MSASRKPGTDILHVAATLCRYGLDPLSGRISQRERDRLHDLQGDLGVRLRRDLDALRAEVARLEADRARLTRILDDLVDGEEPCRFDHHGGCQEHGYISLEPGERCPMGEAMEAALEAVEAAATAAGEPTP